MLKLREVHRYYQGNKFQYIIPYNHNVNYQLKMQINILNRLNLDIYIIIAFVIIEKKYLNCAEEL